MMLRETKDISYSATVDDRLRRWDLYQHGDSADEPSASGKPLICFIHGGAWRSEDKADHADLARRLAQITLCPVAVPNYRLTPSNPPPGIPVFRHPGHAQDILDFLAFILASPLVSSKRFVLIGHSCSAHMLASIFLDSSEVTPSLTPSKAILEAVDAIIMSEGIYDIPLLLESFPKYHEWFIANTFGQTDDYSPFSTTAIALRSHHIRWFLIHSKGDILVDELQSRTMYERLCHLLGESSSTHVSKNFDQLTGEHNDIFKGADYVQILADYIIPYL